MPKLESPVLSPLNTPPVPAPRMHVRPNSSSIAQAEREAVFITTVTLGKGASLAWPHGCVALTSATGSHLDGHHRGVITRIKNQRDVSARASHLFGSCVENRGKRKNTEIVTGFACNPPSLGSPTSTPRCDLEGKRAGGAKTDRTKCFQDPSRERPSASRPHFVPRRREMRALTNSGTGTPAGTPRFCSAGLFSLHGEERRLQVLRALLLHLCPSTD